MLISTYILSKKFNFIHKHTILNLNIYLLCSVAESSNSSTAGRKAKDHKNVSNFEEAAPTVIQVKKQWGNSNNRSSYGVTVQKQLWSCSTISSSVNDQNCLVQQAE